jgi:hypothetical protein
MPIVLNAATGAYVVRCVTNHPNQEPLRPVEGTFSVPRVPLGHGPILRCYYCHVCGYVEFYLAPEVGGVPTGYRGP